jgi:hypothetical protein
VVDAIEDFMRMQSPSVLIGKNHVRLSAAQWPGVGQWKPKIQLKFAYF